MGFTGKIQGGEVGVKWGNMNQLNFRVNVYMLIAKTQTNTFCNQLIQTSTALLPVLSKKSVSPAK